MARINWQKIKRVEKQRNTIHDPVYATYTVFESDVGKYLQIDTYGRIERENPEKISQSFQLTRDDAQRLVKLLIDEFDLK